MSIDSISSRHDFIPFEDDQFDKQTPETPEFKAPLVVEPSDEKLSPLPFEERPLADKVSFIAACIIGAPLLFIYHTSTPLFEGVKWIGSKLGDFASKSLSKLQAVTHTLYFEIFLPISAFIVREAKKVYDEFLAPLGQTIQKLAQKAFTDFIQPAFEDVRIGSINLAKQAYTWIRNDLFPLINHLMGEALVLLKGAYQTVNEWGSDVIIWVQTTIAPRLERAVKALSQALFVDFPKLMDENILTPLSPYIKIASDWTFTNILNPLGKAIHAVASFLFFYFQKPLEWIHQEILSPLRDDIQIVAKAIFVTFPPLFLEHVLIPLKDGIVNGANWTFTHILTPLKETTVKVFETAIPAISSTISYISTQFFETFVPFVHQEVLVPLHEAFSFSLNWTKERALPFLAETFDTIGKAIRSTAVSAYEFLLPIAQKVAQVVIDQFEIFSAFVQRVIIEPAKVGLEATRVAISSSFEQAGVSLSDAYSAIERSFQNFRFP